MDKFSKAFFVIGFVCFLMMGCGTDTVQTSNIQTVPLNTETIDSIEQKNAKICNYLSTIYEEYLAEMSGVEDVNCCVDYDENSGGFSIKVNITILAEYENIIDEIEPALHNEFVNVDICTELINRTICNE